jgi:hypothetical protein
VQNLGRGRAHARALTGGENDSGAFGHGRGVSC